MFWSSRFAVAALASCASGALQGSTIQGYSPDNADAGVSAIDFSFNINANGDMLGSNNDKCHFQTSNKVCPSTCNTMTGAADQTASVVVDTTKTGEGAVSATFDFSQAAAPNLDMMWKLCCDVDAGGSCVEQTGKQVYVRNNAPAPTFGPPPTIYIAPTPMPVDTPVPSMSPPTMMPTMDPPTSSSSNIPPTVFINAPTVSGEFNGALLSAAPSSWALCACILAMANQRF